MTTESASDEPPRLVLEHWLDVPFIIESADHLTLSMTLKWNVCDGRLHLAFDKIWMHLHFDSVTHLI